jgi:hypothetical protein
MKKNLQISNNKINSRYETSKENKQAIQRKIVKWLKKQALGKENQIKMRQHIHY